MGHRWPPVHIQLTDLEHKTQLGGQRSHGGGRRGFNYDDEMPQKDSGWKNGVFCVSDLFRIAAEFEGDVVDDVLGNQHALRHPKASEGRVGREVGLAGQRTATEVRDVVGIVEMEQDFLSDLGKSNKLS